ncbi:hypothetical protein H0H81_000242 [Sphagnurus paluster]|uniref:F-box domain-containing protein n=1 Tax=Sphagnurus paluster TaxID=117069 RepID=A0A9P7KKB0_9AGAR|nr:hypothetical protein H0H81_000242 [Sphagnurus paluster]
MAKTVESVNGSQWSLKLHTHSEPKLSISCLPHEMWINIFEEMNSPSHLLQVIQTCRHFYYLAIRVLYRDISWLSPFQYTNNAPFWNSHASSMKLVPNSLTISICLLPATPRLHDPAVGIVEGDGSWTPTGAPSLTYPPEIAHAHACFSPKNFTFYASHAMYTTLMKQVSTFTMLQTLVFHMSELPISVFTTIVALPRLRSLSLQYCTLPLMDLEPDPRFSDLPITELTLWFNKGDPGAFTHSNYTYMLYLCTAKNLRTLRIDWNPTTGRFLSRQNTDTPIEPLVALTELSIRFNPGRSLWPREDSDFALTAFLHGSPHIERFHCLARRSMIGLPSTMVPKLSSYKGVLVGVLGLVRSRPIEHVELTDADQRLADVVAMLKDLATLRPRLRTLGFRVYKWDEEVMYALIKLFEDVRILQIKFSDGCVEEQTLLSLGALFLHHFPSLEILQLYKATLPTLIVDDQFPRPPPSYLHKPSDDLRTSFPVDDDIVVKESLTAWRKSCPNLREVQLTERFVWRRASCRDEWCKRASPRASTKLFELY